MTDEVNEMSAASRGSQPAAWAVFDGPDRMHLAPGYGEAESCAEDIGGEIVPLYRKPTLTDEEREAIERDLSWLQWCEDNRQIGDVGRKDIATLRGLLERLG
jgi:hypothetical protein